MACTGAATVAAIEAWSAAVLGALMASDTAAAAQGGGGAAVSIAGFNVTAAASVSVAAEDRVLPCDGSRLRLALARWEPLQEVAVPALRALTATVAEVTVAPVTFSFSMESSRDNAATARLRKRVVVKRDATVGVVLRRRRCRGCAGC